MLTFLLGSYNNSICFKNVIREVQTQNSFANFYLNWVKNPMELNVSPITYNTPISVRFCFLRKCNTDTTLQCTFCYLNTVKII